MKLRKKEHCGDESNEIDKLYDKTELPFKVGFANFVNEGLEYAVEGEYAIVEDFNGKAGSHFAFEVVATELTKMPKNYEDVCDYEDSLFTISVGYFDDEPLSEDENENGIIISGFSDIEGKTFDLNSGDGYIFDINTVETDEIDKGQIKFLKWNDKKKVVAFKFSVPYGLHDVVAGTVSFDECDV